MTVTLGSPLLENSEEMRIAGLLVIAVDVPSLRPVGGWKEE
jgi:hypothetical protein